ncbi:hypothetical protein [Burkholderia anthina]|uniref:hypothetical protein n=1 Tax=Burkholderia anthina TaxID=179879 RepID=UPI001589B974
MAFQSTELVIRQPPPSTLMATVCIAFTDKSVLASNSLVTKKPTNSLRLSTGRFGLIW